MLLDKPYGFALDWWGFGTLMYALLCQQAPFLGEHVEDIFDAILNSEPSYPEHLPPAATSFLQTLLTRDPDHRLGSGPTYAEEVMKHPYFTDTDWDALYHKQMPAPFLPTITHRTDTSNFDL